MTNYTVSFNKDNFANAVNILGFKHLYAIDKMEGKSLETYINDIKNIYVEIRWNPFQIKIISKKQSFTENSYERAYNIIHRLST